MTKSGLGPHVVGQRVVVRRLIRGVTGPSGGPAMTDLLGICESWTGESAAIRGEDGILTEIPLTDIVSGKPVPPRPSRFRRLSDAEVDARCDQLREAPPIGVIDVHLIGIASLVRSVGEAAGGDVVVSTPGEGTLAVEVLLDGTSLAGATVRHDADWALLTKLSVDPERRRRGVRRMLIGALAGVLAEHGISALAIEVPAEDVAANTLAAALGFELHHRRS